MKYKNSLLAFEEDIKNRSFLDWLKAHTSGFKPLHRYEGELKVNREEISFKGRDVKRDSDFQLKISLRQIADVHYGFDQVFKGREERAWPWNKPLRTTYRNGRRRRKIYLFARFHHRKGIRSSDNRLVYEKLRKLMNPSSRSDPAVNLSGDN